MRILMSIVDCGYYGYVECMNSYMKLGLGFMLGIENNCAWYKYMISTLLMKLVLLYAKHIYVFMYEHVELYTMGTAVEYFEF